MADIGTVKKIDIQEEMEVAYLDYAMSVIVSRALPDVRDGLKPVHRRILYAMYDMGMRPNRPHKKSARIVGEVLGKYHPHGDSAVYDTMVRMAQDFSMRYPLVDGQGNFGSVDGDAPAAMRYTEVRPTPMTMEMLVDIDMDTVDFTENFDGALQEPTVLPSAVPNLLINGASGIAVAMTTNIPPHNLGEICDALCFLLDNFERIDEIVAEDLLQFVQGPDFPTGGIIYRHRDDRRYDEADTIMNAYAKGRGRIVMEARTHVEEMSRNRHRLVITELPYQVNKSNLIERIAKLARDGVLENLTDLRDESDRSGMRVVLELSRNAEPTEVLDTLFKKTPMRQTFGVIMLALVDGQPRMLSLKSALKHFLDHRIEVIRRRSEYELERARHREHILEGLRIALDDLDEIIDTIRRSRRVDTARRNLKRKFKLTLEQAQAILDMQLRRLSAIERRKIEEEYKDTVKRIGYLEDLLQTPAKIRGVIRDELVEIREKYADPRRTLVVTDAEYTGEVSTDALIADGPVVLTVSDSGEIERIVNMANKPRSGKGLHLIQTAENRHDLLVLTESGRGWRRQVHLAPQQTSNVTGTTLSQWLAGYDWRDRAVALLDFPKEATESEAGSLVMVSRLGRVMRIASRDLPDITVDEEVFGIEGDDRLIWAGLAVGTPLASAQADDELLLVTRGGQAIRFKLDEVRTMGAGAKGVYGVKLQGTDDAVVGAGLCSQGDDLFILSETGYAKRVAVEEFPVQGRYGKGVIVLKPNKTVGAPFAAAVVDASDRLLIQTKKKSRLVAPTKASQYGRTANGDRLLKIAKRDSLTHFARWSSRPAWPSTETGPITIEAPKEVASTTKKRKETKKQKKTRKKRKRRSTTAVKPPS